MYRKAFLMFIITTLIISSLVASTIVSSSIVSISAQKVVGGDVQQSYSFVRKWGSHGTGDGQFQRVHDLAFDPLEKRLYVSDRDGNRIQVFDKNGTFLFKWGTKGTGDGQFTVPYSVDVDSQGNVWVADRGNHRIQKFDKDGNFLFKFGNETPHPSDALGKFDNPRQVYVDKM